MTNSNAETISLYPLTDDPNPTEHIVISFHTNGRKLKGSFDINSQEELDKAILILQNDPSVRASNIRVVTRTPIQSKDVRS
jgi:hypothetical protein